MSEQQRVARITRPTASFSLDLQHVRWIAAEAKRRKTTKSVIVRELFDHAMTQTRQSASPR